MTMGKISMRCEACDLTLNSDHQAQQHFSGKSHAKKLKAKGLPANANTAVKVSTPVGAPPARISRFSSPIAFVPAGAAAANQTQQQQNTNYTGGTADPVSQAVVDNALGKLPKKRKQEIPCAVCELVFNSDSQATVHFHGSKHQKRLKLVKEMRKSLEEKKEEESGQTSTVADKVKDKDMPAVTSPTGAITSTSPYYCFFCNIGTNSPQQLEAHREGAAHKRMIQQAAGGQVKKSGELPGRQTKFYCKVCDISVSTPGQLNQHVNSLDHQDRAAGRPVRQVPDQSGGQPSTPPYLESAEPELVAKGWNWEQDAEQNKHLQIEHDPQPETVTAAATEDTEVSQ